MTSYDRVIRDLFDRDREKIEKNWKLCQFCEMCTNAMIKDSWISTNQIYTHFVLSQLSKVFFVNAGLLVSCIVVNVNANEYDVVFLLKQVTCMVSCIVLIDSSQIILFCH